MSTPHKLERKTFPRRGVLRNGNPTNRSSSTSSSQSLRGRRRQPTRSLKSNKSPSRNYTKKQGASETSRHHTRTPSSTSPSQSFRGRRRQPTKSLNSNKQGTARTGETSRHNTRIGVVEWKGLEVADHKIVWPPMVVIQNTRSHKDESGKWAGVRKTDLLGCFKHHDIRNVKNAYGFAGHCGVSLLIFDSSAVGYFEAESLHRQFIREGRGKSEWETRGGHTHSVGERLLYGYMATEGDMELLNRLSRGKQKHKFEMESYEMMVVNPMKKMKDNDDKLRLRKIEVETIRQRANKELEESKKEIDYLDQHYADAIKELRDDLEKAMKPEKTQ